MLTHHEEEREKGEEHDHGHCANRLTGDLDACNGDPDPADHEEGDEQYDAGNHSGGDGNPLPR